jgi:hypothetical protein
VTRGKASSELVVAGVLAEFAALRAEIDRRSNEQHAVMGLSITATAALAAFVISRDHYELLPLFPILTAVLGMRWLDHHRRIREIGDYIREDINRRLSEWTQVDDLLGAEKELEDAQAYRIVLTLLVATTFALPTAGAIAGAIAHRSGSTVWNWAFLGFAVGVFGVTLAYWIRQFVAPAFADVHTGSRLRSRSAARRASGERERT